MSVPAPAPAPAAAAAAGAPRQVTPADVGWQFVPQYYTFVNKQPHKLHCFYNRNSTFTHGTEGEDVKHLSGQAQIHDKIVSLGFSDCKVYINSVDAQSSIAGGIIIQVIGEMSNAGEPWKKFAQTFFLAEQPNGYYVLNDIFRFLKEETLADGAEEGEEEAADTEVPAEPAQAEAVSGGAHSELAMEAAAQQPQAVNGFHPELDKPAEEPAEAETEVVDVAPPLPEQPATSTVVAPAPAVEEPTPAPAAPEPAQEEEKPAQVVDVAPPMPEQPAQSTVAAPAPVPAAAPAPAAAAPPAPAQPAPAPGPKTWAALASKDSNRWGANVASEARGVSAAPPPSRTPAAPSPAPSTQPQPQPRAHDGLHPAAQAALAVPNGQCFVKAVTENISSSALHTLLTQRFGPIKELEIVRSKACAFLEFQGADAARKAILASLPVSQGGEGGVRVPLEGGGEARVHVEQRKERGERPVSNRGRGAASGQGEGRGSYRGRGGGEGGRGAGRGGGERGRGRGQGQGQQQQQQGGQGGQQQAK
ncbi:hypothetical protein CALCODRAFT_489795 [Calocera cornea HHB12733]|uniref:NTF2-domain-containing protein n=1 Tax=Calocera cornea HHB12733 TaxID=1353952 RepID=A0A165JYJ0_9BASI|nr:hypothetical protein CALCODRAFT_489795 [Calocera cornea HHB12733]